MAIINHTKNGEITFNSETGEYIVWDEIYVDKICVTNYPKIAEAALAIYGEHYIDGPKIENKTCEGCFFLENKQCPFPPQKKTNSVGDILMQSKKHSFLETGSNLVIGYIVAVASQMVFYHYYEIKISLNDNMVICVWMTVVSILRSYTLRRWWNRRTVKQFELMKVEATKGTEAALRDIATRKDDFIIVDIQEEISEQAWNNLIKETIK